MIPYADSPPVPEMPGGIDGAETLSIDLVLADAQPIYLLGLRHLLAAYPGFRVKASCADGEEALRAVLDGKPDVAVMDLDLPGRHALEVLGELQRQASGTKTVLLTARIDENQVLDAIRLGVRGVVLKTMPPHLLVRCLHQVHAGGEWLEKRSVSLALDKLLNQEASRQQLREQLTPRELELTLLAASGLSNREIGQRLFIAEGTVKAHLHRVFDKLGVKSRMALSLVAREKGWL